MAGCFLEPQNDRALDIVKVAMMRTSCLLASLVMFTFLWLLLSIQEVMNIHILYISTKVNTCTR